MTFRWLFDLTLPSRVLHFSTTTVVVDGVQYRPGLAPLDAGQSDEELEIELLDATTDWPTVGPLLDGAEVLLRRWRDDLPISRAETYARGVARSVEYGGRFERVKFLILDEGQADELGMPDYSRRVTSRTAPDTTPVGLEIPPVQAGMYYPVVFGNPGWAPDLRSDGMPFPVVPAPLRQYPIAFGPVIDQAFELSQVVVSADTATCLPATVFVRDNESSDEYEQTVFTTSDKLRQRIAVADFTLNTDGLPFADAAELTVGYFPGPGLRQLYDVWRYALEHWSADAVDWSRIPEIEGLAEGFMVDTWITDTVKGSVWSWLENVFLDTVPFAVRTGTAGRYFVPLFYTIDARRTVRELTVGQNVSRLTPVTTSGEVVNDLRIGYRDAGDGYMDGVTISGINPGYDPADFITHGRCIASQARYGVRSGELVELSWSWDLLTAIRVGEWMVERDALPARMVRYQVPEELGLRESDQVRIIDDEIGLNELAIVDEPPVVGKALGASVLLRIPEAG